MAAACREPVVALSSLPAPAAHPFADWVTLAPDPALPDPDDPTAGGALHWAPLDSPRYRARMRTLADWVATAAPRLVHVDVSVEVAALVRLLGTPVTVSAMPGARDDPAHALAYSMASLIIAAWPADVPIAHALREHAHKLRHVGAVSRFDGRPRVAPHTGRVLVLLGAGGTTAAGDLDAVLQRAGWDARVLGGGSGWSDDPWTELCAAEVVVTNAGQNAVAEVAAAARPAVVVPESRPFGEQHATAALLAAARSRARRARLAGRTAVARAAGARPPPGRPELAAVERRRRRRAVRAGPRGRRMSPVASRIAVVTVVSGRHAHLRAQRRGLAAAHPPPHEHVVVAVGDSAIAAVAAEQPDLPTTVVELATTPAGLPVAAARNRGAAAALAGGADVLIFLDVDCIPGPELVDTYRAAVAEHPDALLCGPVTYLPPAPAGGWTAPALAAARAPHAARPDPRPGHVTALEPALFWSLSFALSAELWQRIGGFHEGYVGYGAEDTDFAATAARLDVADPDGRRRRRVPPAPPGQQPAPRAPRRHRPQQRRLPPPARRAAHGRLAGRVHRRTARSPRTTTASCAASTPRGC